MIVVYILLFIVFLGLLIMIHELGHLMTAKMFKVYCFEYSIGFGPKLFSKKRKGGETAFSIRAIPFGGFVSMYGEDDTVPEGVNVDPSRSLNNTKKWKKAIIMSAGVIMNMILAIVMFFIYEAAFPKNVIYTYQVNVTPNSIASNLGIKNGDTLFSMYYSTNASSLVLYDNEALLEYEDSSLNKTIFFGADYSSITLSDTAVSTRVVGYEKINVNEESILIAPEKTIEEIVNGEYEEGVQYKVRGYSLTSITINENQSGTLIFSIGQDYRGNANNILQLRLPIKGGSNYCIPKYQTFEVVGEIKKDNNILYLEGEEDQFKFSSIDISKNYFISQDKGNFPTKVSFFVEKSENDESPSEKILFQNIEVTQIGTRTYLPIDLGLNLRMDSYRISGKEVFKNTFTDFADSATLIGRGLAKLFSSSEAWKDVGGIIAIGVTTTQTLKENGFGQYLFFWAMISVNLAIVNLLPFPGLDGWHLLVTVIEGVTRKELPNKFKTWASAIGLILLFSLMILIVIKDVITFI